MALSLALYDLMYTDLRGTLRAPSVSRDTFQAWAIAESGCADTATGRDCRPSVRHLIRAISRSRRTVQRCRELSKLLDMRQVVFRGRQRTKIERLESWEREDRSRGWTAVAALIDSPAYAHLVDNSVIELTVQLVFGAPPPRRGGSVSISSTSVVTSEKNVRKRRAPRDRDTKGRTKTTRSYDQEALLLASRTRSDERFPLWLRRLGVKGLAGVLTPYAVGGWDADDVYEAMEDVRRSGQRILTAPRNPHAYLRWLLGFTEVTAPPAAHDRAREDRIERERRAQIRHDAEQRRADALAAVPAGPDSPGRRAAMAVAAGAGQKAISSSAQRSARGREAQQELARQALGF
ncbi:hypothetical protein AB0H60_31670 [Nocardia rhamnosiphila]|uniref:hypothetical protein n=1 Tax=Nocardia rhamnosiphila TaxID=426716 RepID=UPI003403A21F